MPLAMLACIYEVRTHTYVFLLGRHVKKGPHVQQGKAASHMHKPGEGHAKDVETLCEADPAEDLLEY